MSRELIRSGTEWEDAVGYSRAVRVGSEVFVSGTTATDETGAVVGEGDPYVQTTQALSNIEAALASAEASLDDVVRTRIYVTDVSHWDEIGRAHREAFGAAGPAATMVQVAALIDPAMLVELEVTARIGSGEPIEETRLGD